MKQSERDQIRSGYKSISSLEAELDAATENTAKFWSLVQELAKRNVDDNARAEATVTQLEFEIKAVTEETNNVVSLSAFRAMRTKGEL